MNIFKKVVIGLTCLVILLTVSSCNSNVTESSDESSESSYDVSLGGLTSISNITVETINISLTEEDFADILANPTDEEFHSADLSTDDTTLYNVAFRTKGNSSLTSVANSESERYGFKVKTNKYVDDQYLDGTNEFVLNACYNDPSYLREYITYNASDFLGLYTPETKFVWLTINDEDYGLYLYVESYDDTFIDSNTTSSDTNLYKADGENCTVTISDGISGFENKSGSDDEMYNVQALINTLDAFDSVDTTDIEKLLNVESVLKWTALSYVCGNYDSYIGSKAHNYYLLYTDSKFNMVGWDYNMAFGGFPEDNGSSLTLDASSPYLKTTEDDRPLVSKLLAVDEYNELYLSYVDSLKSYLGDYETAIPLMASNIRSYVEKDPTAFYTVAEFDAAIAGTDMTMDDISEVGNNLPNTGGGMLPPNGGDSMLPPDRDDSAIPENGDESMLPPDAGGTRPEMGSDTNLPESGTETNLPPADGMNAVAGSSSVDTEVISITDFLRLRLS